MNGVNAMCLGSADPTTDEVLHRGRQASSRLGLFGGDFFFLFLAEVPHSDGNEFEQHSLLSSSPI